VVRQEFLSNANGADWIGGALNTSERPEQFAKVYGKSKPIIDKSIKHLVVSESIILSSLLFIAGSKKCDAIEVCPEEPTWFLRIVPFVTIIGGSLIGVWWTVRDGKEDNQKDQQTRINSEEETQIFFGQTA